MTNYAFEEKIDIVISNDRAFRIILRDNHDFKVIVGKNTAIGIAAKISGKNDIATERDINNALKGKTLTLHIE